MTSLFSGAFTRRLVLAALLAFPVLTSRGANPAFTANASVHDPSVVREGDKFYVFGSHLASASTTDLMNWTQISTTATAGNALVPNPSVEFAETLAWAQTNTFWAPDVIKLADGKFYYYYCACKGDSPLSALGLAVSDSITGPYKNVGIMLKSGMWGKVSPDGKIYDNAIHPNVVDPSVFFDKNGKFWMVYGSYSGGIFIMELDPTTGLQLPNQGYGKKLMGGNNTTIEGPYIIYSPETDYYYLFVTYGGLTANGGYNIRMGRSRTADGPYLDAAGNDLIKATGAFGTLFDNVSIAPYGVKLMGNYQFLHVAGEPGSVSRGYLSPGGSSIYRDPATGRYLLNIHIRFVGRGEEHEVRVHQMFLNEDGWFVIAPQRYAKEAISTTDTATIPGDYKLINHGKTVTANVVGSVAIKLNPDGTVSGSATGTWAKTGDHYATVTLGGKTYKGVFTQVWDDDNQVWVQSFTAISTDGIAVWGCKVAASTTNTAPAVTTQPLSQSVSAGKSVTLSVAASGTPAPTFQWRRNGVNLAGATGNSFTLAPAAEADAGFYTVVVSNRVTSFLSDVATLTVTPPVPPTLTTQPQSTTVAAGTSASFSITAVEPGPLYQWRRYNDSGIPQAINGATSSVFAIPEATSQEAGRYDCVVTLDGAPAYSAVATLTVGLATASNPGARLVNLSSRTPVGTGATSQIAGFSISGTGSKTVLLRASGPGLAQFEVPGTVADPTMEVFNQVNTELVLHASDDWIGPDVNTLLRDAFVAAGAFGWATGSTDSALLVTLPAGNYTAKVQAKTTQGVCLAEVYEVDTGTTRLANLSTRSPIGTGSDAQIAGFVIRGTGLKTVLVRVAGPGLGQFGVPGTVEDPIVRVYDQADTNFAFASNDNWDADPAEGPVIASAAVTAGAFAFAAGSTDAALLLTLRPGNYSAVATSKGASGVGIIELYEMNP